MTRVAFSVIPILFSVVWVAVAIFILTRVVRAAKQSRTNAASPRIVAPATLVVKRTGFTTHSAMRGMGNQTALSDTTHTAYYFATFEFLSGDRMEFSVDAGFYGLSMESDHGMLTFRGTEFLDFQRD